METGKKAVKSPIGNLWPLDVFAQRRGGRSPGYATGPSVWAQDLERAVKRYKATGMMGGFGPKDAPGAAGDGGMGGGYQYPEAMSAPSFLNLPSMMTPFQQRTRIASGALESGGSWSSPEAIDYYSNLFQRGFLSPQGSVIQGEIMPVEWRFLREIVGQEPKRETPQGFLDALLI